VRSSDSTHLCAAAVRIHGHGATQNTLAQSPITRLIRKVSQPLRPASWTLILISIPWNVREPSVYSAWKMPVCLRRSEPSAIRIGIRSPGMWMRNTCGISQQGSLSPVPNPHVLWLELRLTMMTISRTTLCKYTVSYTPRDPWITGRVGRGGKEGCHYSATAETLDLVDVPEGVCEAHPRGRGI
jgi:hypothetical protein